MITPDATERREAARQTDGRFGHQHHSNPTVPSALPYPDAFPESSVVGGQELDLRHFRTDPQFSFVEAPWPSSVPRPVEMSVTEPRSGTYVVEAVMENGDSIEASGNLEGGDYSHAWDSFEAGDGERFNLDIGEQEAIREHLRTALRRYAAVSVAAHDRSLRSGAERDAAALALPNELVTPEQLADERVAQAAHEAGLPVMVGLLEVLRDRGQLSNEQAERLTAGDMEEMWGRVATVLDAIGSEFEAAQR